ncbi:hypothetical protein ACFQ3W_16960 [Paenibacillus puldeungensis]|uniref:DinB family protein n=1 Tax=Paenibacillus puldeungensis TaxID=696536 RepID=A0ABW3RZP0_9BACL
MEQEEMDVFLRITMHRMCDLYFEKLKVAMEGLSQQDLWTEPYPEGNTVGGIALHVCEHIARSCLRLKRMEGELKLHFENFFPKETLTAEEIIAMFEAQLKEWRLLMYRYINKEHVMNEDDVHQLYHLVEHTSYHLGQVIDRIQGMTGKKFAFCNHGLNEAYLRRKVESREV